MRKGQSMGAILIYLSISVGLLMLGLITMVQDEIDTVDLSLEVSVEDRIVQSTYNKAAFQTLQAALFSTYEGTQIIDLISQSIHCDNYDLRGTDDTKCENVPSRSELQDIIATHIELYSKPTYQFQVYDGEFDADATPYLSVSDGDFTGISGYTRMPIALYGDKIGFVVFRYENANYQVVME